MNILFQAMKPGFLHQCQSNIQETFLKRSLFNRNSNMFHSTLLFSFNQQTQTQLTQLHSTLIQQRGYKTKDVIKKKCDHCYLVTRKGVQRIICKVNPRHKQRMTPVKEPPREA